MRWLWTFLLVFSLPAWASGQLSFTPEHGPVGSRVEARAEGLPPRTDLELVWTTARAAWRIEETLYKGVSSSEQKRVITRVTSDANGSARFSFTVPEDYGYTHNVALVQAATEVARQGFVVVPALSISPTSGPLGTPITVRVTGLGHRFYERGRHLYYDEKYTGWVTGITTGGTASFVIRATGETGPHLIELMNGPRRGYLNMQQSPNFLPAIPYRTAVVFNVTRGPVVRPPAPELQAPARETAKLLPPGVGPQLSADMKSGPVGSLVRFMASGLPANSKATLSYKTVRGNRIGGGGWDEAEVPLGSFSTDASGTLQVALPTPDDLEGERVFSVRSGEESASYGYRITPSVAQFGPARIRPGGEITLNLKGTGWTSTGNIYTVLLDNSYVGYACGFNSGGDITLTLSAPMKRGWHFIALYPSIYEGRSDAPTTTTTNDHFQLPMLNAIDHPGEKLPVFHLAFEVR